MPVSPSYNCAIAIFELETSDNWCATAIAKGYSKSFIGSDRNHTEVSAFKALKEFLKSSLNLKLVEGQFTPADIKLFS